MAPLRDGGRYPSDVIAGRRGGFQARPYTRAFPDIRYELQNLCPGRKGLPGPLLITTARMLAPREKAPAVSGLFLALRAARLAVGRRIWSRSSRRFKPFGGRVNDAYPKCFLIRSLRCAKTA